MKRIGSYHTYPYFQTMLHYHIKETMPNSSLFTALENVKAAYPNLIEDYSATETTFEEVFLSFAQKSRAKSSLPNLD